MARILWRQPGTHALRWMIQHHLKRVNRYFGPADGVWGPETIKGVQRTTRLVTSPPTVVDGVPGTETAWGVEYYATGKNLDWPNSHLTDGMWQLFHDRLGAVPTPGGGSTPV